MTHQIFGSFVAAEGKRDELAGHLLDAASLMRRNSGCLLYLVATTDDPDEVAVTEVWTDADAHRASLEDKSVGELIGRARPTIAGMKTRLELQVLGGKGLPG